MTIWRHVVIGTRSSWLHGDPRGFHDRDHRLHSSGDYKNPPPPQEHEGLHRYYQGRAQDSTDLPLRPRIVICQAFVQKMRSIGLRIIASAVSDRHVHALVEMPGNYHDSIKIIGRCKQKASHAVRHELPGQIWSARATLKRIRTKSHLRNSYNYIRTRQEVGSIRWSHNETENWIDNISLDIVIMTARKTQGCLPRAHAGL